MAEKKPIKIDLELFSEAERSLKRGLPFRKDLSVVEMKTMVGGISTQLLGQYPEISATTTKLDLTFLPRARFNFATEIAVTKPVNANIQISALMINAPTEGQIMTRDLTYKDNFGFVTRNLIKAFAGDTVEGMVKTAMTDPTKALREVLAEQMGLRGVAMQNAAFKIGDGVCNIALVGRAK